MIKTDENTEDVLFLGGGEGRRGSKAIDCVDLLIRYTVWFKYLAQHTRYFKPKDLVPLRFLVN